MSLQAIGVYLLGVPVTSVGLTVITNQTWYKKIYRRKLHDDDIMVASVIWPATVPLFTANLIACVPQYYLEEKYYKKRDP
jgi:hypothetical protein